MNLYDISKDCGFKLDEDVLLAFAAALATDTAFLRTAGSEELTYLGKFLGRRKMEDVFEVVLGNRIELKTFIKDLEGIEVSNGICYGRFSRDDHFIFFADSLMYSLGCKTVVGLLEWGVWVFTRKKDVQHVFSKLKELDRLGYERRVGKIYGLKDLDLIKELLSQNRR